MTFVTGGDEISLSFYGGEADNAGDLDNNVVLEPNLDPKYIAMEVVADRDQVVRMLDEDGMFIECAGYGRHACHRQGGLTACPTVRSNST